MKTLTVVAVGGVEHGGWVWPTGVRVRRRVWPVHDYSCTRPCDTVGVPWVNFDEREVVDSVTTAPFVAWLCHLMEHATDSHGRAQSVAVTVSDSRRVSLSVTVMVSVTVRTSSSRRTETTE